MIRKGFPDEDCFEADHLWERLSDGSYLCIWCDAKVRRVGAKAHKKKVANESKVQNHAAEETREEA